MDYKLWTVFDFPVTFQWKTLRDIRIHVKISIIHYRMV